jgi:hypothetical protein
MMGSKTDVFCRERSVCWVVRPTCSVENLVYDG